MLAPRYSPWNRIVCFVLGSSLITAAFYAVVFLALSVSRSLAESRPPLDAGDLERAELGIMVLSYPPVLGWIVYCRHFLDRRSVRSMGLRADRRGRSLLLGALGGALAVSWLCGAMWLCGALVFGGTSPEAFERTAAQVAMSLGAYALLFAAVGFMEELSFRGYLLHNLCASVGLRRAVWAQAIVFALVHVPNAAGKAQDASIAGAAWVDTARALPSLALIGAIFALMWAKSGTLWPSIGFHFAWNFCLGCVFSLPVSGLSTFRLFDLQAVGSPWISGGTFGAEGSILLWPILLAAWWVLSQMPDHPQAARDLSLLDPAHPATLSEAQMAQAQAVLEEPEEQEEEAREPRFRTTMRPRSEAEEVEGRPSEPMDFAPVGQLPRGHDAEPWAHATSSEALAPGPTIFSPLPFDRERHQAPDPGPMPGGVPDATLQIGAEPIRAGETSWAPEPAMGPATPQVLGAPESLPQQQTEPQEAPSAASDGAPATEAPAEEAPRLPRPTLRW